MGAQDIQGPARPWTVHNAPMAGNPHNLLPWVPTQPSRYLLHWVEVGARGHKDIDKETKDVEETAQSFDQNLSGTATLENTRQVQSWQSAISLQYHINADTDWKYQLHSLLLTLLNCIYQ